MLEHLLVFSCNVIDVIKKLHLCHSRRTQEDALAFLIFFFLFFLKEMKVNPNGDVKLKKKKKLEN
jgi:hypothetical protein